MPPTLRAARIRRQVLRVGEKRLEELLMELVKRSWVSFRSPKSGCLPKRATARS